MATRYDDRLSFNNAEPMYFEQIFVSRGLRYITQYVTPSFTNPTEEDISDLTVLSYIWSRGDRLYKLSNKYYGSPTYWWVIAWFNQKPLESDFKMGDVISIPLPLEDVLEISDF